MEPGAGGPGKSKKVEEDVRAHFGADVCSIARSTCPVLADTRPEWWDAACVECEKTRVEMAPEMSDWTRYILDLHHEVHECGVPYGVEDLTPLEWRCLGVVNRAKKSGEQTVPDSFMRSSLRSFPFGMI